MTTNKIYNVDLVNFPDKKLMKEFAKKMCFDERASGSESVRGKSLIRLVVKVIELNPL